MASLSDYTLLFFIVKQVITCRRYCLLAGYILHLAVPSRMRQLHRPISVVYCGFIRDDNS